MAIHLLCEPGCVSLSLCTSVSHLHGAQNAISSLDSWTSERPWETYLSPDSSQPGAGAKKTHTHTYTCVLHKQPQYKAVSSKGWGMKGMLGELRRNLSCWGGGQGLSRIKINSHLQCTFPVSGIFCTYFNCMANGKEELGFRFCR